MTIKPICGKCGNQLEQCQCENKQTKKGEIMTPYPKEQNTIGLQETLVLGEILEQLEQAADFINDEQLSNAVELLSEFVILYGADESEAAE